uniref:C-type lectin domain-containing protein n=1 Tax=Chelydra serpentina TaxID=8475 RepID=A0A8C3RN72_CHESE
MHRSQGSETPAALPVQASCASSQPEMVASKCHFSPLDLPAAACPDDWIGYRGKCYLFSKAAGNWTSGQSNCSSLGASLAVIDTQKDLDFLQQYKGSPAHWIGLWRSDPAQPWKWADGTEFNNSLRCLFNFMKLPKYQKFC